MKLAIPKEIEANECRVAATPETVKKLTASGFEVTVEAGAGEPSSILDSDYEAVGATIIKEAKSLFREADVVLKVQKPTFNKALGCHETDLLKEGSVLIALLQPQLNPDLLKKLTAKNITAFSMDTIPRIARAQKLDALSSQSNVAGYKAVLMAANAFGKLMPLMMTAAGTIPPAKVFVIGAGVAGLQAIATAKRLGAVIKAFDTRPAVKNEVESLGAKFVELDIEQQDTEDEGGYAKELSKDAHEKELKLLTEHVKAADIVITTAQIPGKPAPVLITEEAVREMKPGSVIVDLAMEGGGNCALSETGQVVIKHDVTIIGYTNVPSLMSAQSSTLYARNVLGLLLEIVKDKALHLDLSNEIVKGTLVTHQGGIPGSGAANAVSVKGGS